jgi:hypothetical protein
LGGDPDGGAPSVRIRAGLCIPDGSADWSQSTPLACATLEIIPLGWYPMELV